VLRRNWWLACLASTLGLLWSVEIGLYSIAATTVMLILTRPRTWAPVVPICPPFVILLIVRADIHHFFVDSFVSIPKAADAIAALPARPMTLDWEAARYYLPPVFYGLSFVLPLSAWRRRHNARAPPLARD